jgi:two-component system sensor histidine kinase KdpD
MQIVERIPVLERQVGWRWARFWLQTALAFGSTMAVTVVLFLCNLYPRIPDIAIVYLLVILLLASTFGRYAALLASLVASLSFDFFMVPPIYTFTMFRMEEWIALFVFLVTALLTSQLTLRLRWERNQAHEREREARILYELIRLTNSREGLTDQLEVVLLSLAHVFAAWGVYACALLLPDNEGALTQLVDVSLDEGNFVLSREEHLLAVRALLSGEVQDQRALAQPEVQDNIEHVSVYRQGAKSVSVIEMLRLIPLRSGSQILGVLCLRLRNPAPWFARAVQASERIEKEDDQDAQMAFFWTFLAQVTSILERAQLRSSVQPWA